MGSYISGLAGSRDAPGDTSTTYTLAANEIGYGALISSSYYEADLDVYDLGFSTLGPMC